MTYDADALRMADDRVAIALRGALDAVEVAYQSVGGITVRTVIMPVRV